MPVKEKFTVKEWETLEMSVLWMFQAVSSADKKIDMNELNALTFIVNNSDKFDNALMREILADLKYELPKIDSIYKVDQNSITDGFTLVKEILLKAEPAVALEFKKSLLAFGKILANASGSWIAPHTSQEELEALQSLSDLLGLSAEDIDKKPTIKEIMSKLHQERFS